MKNLLFAFCVSILAFSAQASIHDCQVVGGKGLMTNAHTAMIIITSEDSASVNLQESEMTHTFIEGEAVVNAEDYLVITQNQAHHKEYKSLLLRKDGSGQILVVGEGNMASFAFLTNCKLRK